MSPKPPRWVVALITNHGCLLPAAASAAAIPIIDGIYEDSPDQARLKHLSLSLLSPRLRYDWEDESILPCQFQSVLPAQMKPYNDLLSVFSLVPTRPVSNDNTAQTGIIDIIAIHFARSFVSTSQRPLVC